MSIMDIAKDFTHLLKMNDHHGAAAKYNSADIVSCEAMEGPMAMCKGTEAVRQKSEWWYANHDVHSVGVDGPFVNGEQFMVHFKLDVTVKATGQRMAMSEMGLYTVAKGKITEERFFYLHG